MRLTDMTWVRVTNDLVHDVAAGMWPGIVLGVWMMHRGVLTALGAEAAVTLTRASAWVLLAALTAAAVQVATGAVRLSYHYRDVPLEEQSARGRAALWKHAAFVALFVVALGVSFSVLLA